MIKIGLYNTYGIYVIKNKITNFVYVGKTINSFGDRWDCHKAQLRGNYNGNKPLQEAWNEYGEKNFEFKIEIDCTGETLEYVNQKEIETIAYYKSKNLAYNLSDGGDTCYFLGKHLSEESKRKIGEKNKVNMTGKKASQQTKEKMSKSQKKRFENWTNEERHQYSEMMKQRRKDNPTSEDGKKRISQSLKGNKHSAKYTAEMVLQMRYLYEKENKSIKYISELYNIPYGTVSGIVKYLRWSELKLDS